MSEPEFIFVTCQNGAESVLKAEIAREWPMFKLAYSRPGFLTFKVSPDADLGAGFDLRCVFARAYGISLGRAQGATLSERANFTATLARQSLAGRLRLAVWERERSDLSRRGGHDESGGGDGVGADARRALLADVERSIRGAQPDFFLPEGAAQDGDVVLSVVLVEEGEWWIAYHLHSRYHRPWTGGIARIELPAHAPSRAYLKFKEGLNFPGLPVRAGETAIEFGSAPGGASLALLEQGLFVVGVDPADMDAAVLDTPKFRHVRLQAKQVKASDVGAVDWIFGDMNVAPEETIEAVEKFMRAAESIEPGRLLGALLTLKLTNWTHADRVPETVRKMLERLLTIGFSRVQAAQLYYNRHEVSVAAFTIKGEARLAPPVTASDRARGQTRDSALKARQTKS